ncbi:MAG TPA: hypothetical protein GX514_07670 [Thermoanaerobacterales bacterium]|nr:hypothetical protein [Thermoanaerobacterales bacterium]
MLNKKCVALISVLLMTIVFSSAALAANNSTYYYIEDEIGPLSIHKDLFYIYKPFYNAQKIYRDFDKDGVYEIAVIYSGLDGNKHLAVYKIQGNRMVQIFSGKGVTINVNSNGFSISNIKYDGRYFYETYTYTWNNGKFLRTGYAKTYIKNGYDYEKPIKDKPIIRKDERITIVNSFLKARMQGKYDEAMKYLSKAYKSKIDANKLKSIVPYGSVTAVDIFDSQRGDWVVVIIRDIWGTSRVFKFVPVNEKDEYGNFKIDEILEIPRAN